MIRLWLYSAERNYIPGAIFNEFMQQRSSQVPMCSHANGFLLGCKQNARDAYQHMRAQACTNHHRWRRAMIGCGYWRIYSDEDGELSILRWSVFLKNGKQIILTLEPNDWQSQKSSNCKLAIDDCSSRTTELYCNCKVYCQLLPYSYLSILAYPRPCSGIHMSIHGNFCGEPN